MLAVLLFAACLGLTAATESEKKIVCYFRYSQSLLVSPMCTHLVHTFAQLKNNDIEVNSGDLPTPRYSHPGNYWYINRLRVENPYLKTMIAVGKWTDETDEYFKMASNSTFREIFANNAAKFVKKWEFNGLVLHWKFPTFVEPTARDMQNYVEVVKTLRRRFEVEGFALGATVNARESVASKWYNCSEISQYLDFINLLDFDAQSPLYTEGTAINVPLYTPIYRHRRYKELSIEAAVFYWLSQGALRDKLTVGIPTFGYTYTLDDPDEHGVGANTSGVGVPGRYSQIPGILTYKEICKLYKSSDWNFIFDEEYQAPYAFKDHQWIGFNNVKSVNEKAEFTARLSLGGVTLWYAEHDNWLYDCDGVYDPLLATVNAVLRHRGTIPEETLPLTKSENFKCTKPGYFADPSSCGLATCVPNSTGGYDKYHFECMPGNCYNPIIREIRFENVDPDFIICGS